MTFKKWVGETQQRYRTQPITQATKDSFRELLAGGNRRTLDKWIGRTWWSQDNWEVLVILDGARVDVTQSVITEYNVGSTWSPASTSIDWIQRHFDDTNQKYWGSAGYVTANPFAAHNTENAESADLDKKDLGFFNPVYSRAWREVNGINTTPPEDVTDAAISAWREQDIDRLIIHYMQPHQPFRSRPDWASVFTDISDLDTEMNQGRSDIWLRLRDGEIERNELWNAYKDNLVWVWEDVTERLLTNLDASVIITADHGNGMGEWGMWGHQKRQLAPTIRKVPVVGPIKAEDCKTVNPTSVESSVKEIDTDVSTQLDALGYM